MTPAEKPNPLANTLRDASFTKDGKKTTDAPRAVANPAPITKAKATPTFPCATLEGGAVSDILNI
jgi:hypothetical protein